MAYAQWVSFTMKAANFDAFVGGAHRDWGKFYQWDNKDKEVSNSTIDEIELEKGKTYPQEISTCGRENSSSGTEGYFYLYTNKERKDADAICKIYWDCPWGSKTNTWKASDYDPDKYIVSFQGGSQYGGAIGTLTLTIADIS